MDGRLRSRLTTISLILVILAILGISSLSLRIEQATIKIDAVNDRYVYRFEFWIRNDEELAIDTLSLEIPFEPLNVSSGNDLKLTILSERGWMRELKIRTTSPILPGELRIVNFTIVQSAKPSKVGDKYVFTYTFTAPCQIDRLSIYFGLPIGAYLISPVTSPERPSVAPPPNQILSDGRRIWLNWIRDDLKPGEDFLVFAIYEEILRIPGGLESSRESSTGAQEQNSSEAIVAQPPIGERVIRTYPPVLIALTVILGLIALGSSTMLVLVRRKYDELVASLSGLERGGMETSEGEEQAGAGIKLVQLSEDERRIVDILIERGRITQKELQDILNASKAKISRLLTLMESKGLIVRERAGKTNIVELSSEIKESLEGGKKRQ